MIGVAVVFIVMMGVSWIKSRTMEPILDEDKEPTADEQDVLDNTPNKDRFPLD